MYRNEQFERENSSMENTILKSISIVHIVWQHGFSRHMCFQFLAKQDQFKQVIKHNDLTQKQKIKSYKICVVVKAYQDLFIYYVTPFWQKYDPPPPSVMPKRAFYLPSVT